jgi:hypothetical protein
MAKQAKVWTGSAWADLASATTDLTPYSTTAQMNTAIDVGSGLKLLNTTTFTNQTNIDITNVFSSTYDNYKLEILVYNTGSTIDANFTYQLISGSTPATTNYFNATGYVNTAASFAAWSASTSQTSSFIAQYGTNGQISTATMTMFQPNKATYTHTHLQSLNKYGTSSAAAVFGSTGHATATAYDGIRFISSTATAATGTIRIYGVKNS